MAEAAINSPGGASATSKLRNRIFAMRHGESEANIQGLIVSDRHDGCSGYGLTEKGRKQVEEACADMESILHPSHCLPEKIMIVSSDFTRTVETAEIVKDYFHVKSDIRYEPALRERGFGEFHMTSDSNYQKVWDFDARDPEHTEYGNESVMEVALRTSRLLRSLDEEYQDKIIVLVSHGDTLQVLSALFFGVGPNEHRTIPDLAPSQVRELKDNGASMA